MKPIPKLILILFLAISFQLSALSSYAAIPHLINYQGKLSDSAGKPLTGTYNVTFKIYDVEAGGTPLWTETYTGLSVDRGIFNIMLGGVTALNLPFDKQYWLGIQVGSDPEMTPRQRIASSAYAFRAEHGVPKGVIVMWSGTIADIPTGWALCDGTNGTPDLRDKFIIGAKQDDDGVTKTMITGSLTQTGGSTTISVNNLPSHTHGAGILIATSAGEHVHNLFMYTPPSGVDTPLGPSGGRIGNWESSRMQASGSHTHGISGSTSSAGSGIPYTQPYYALAFIMKIE